MHISKAALVRNTFFRHIEYQKVERRRSDLYVLTPEKGLSVNV